MEEKLLAMIELCRELLIDFTRSGLEKSHDFSQITVYDIDNFAEDWVLENFDEDEDEAPSLFGGLNPYLSSSIPITAQEYPGFKPFPIDGGMTHVSEEVSQNEHDPLSE